MKKNNKKTKVIISIILASLLVHISEFAFKKEKNSPENQNDVLENQESQLLESERIFYGEAIGADFLWFESSDLPPNT
jgi:hypothetical protein